MKPGKWRGGAGRPGEKILEMWSMVRIRISPGTGTGNLELETDPPTELRGEQPTTGRQA